MSVAGAAQAWLSNAGTQKAIAKRIMAMTSKRLMALASDFTIVSRYHLFMAKATFTSLDRRASHSDPRMPLEGAVSPTTTRLH